MREFKPGAARALFLATTALAISYAVWGLIAALTPAFSQLYDLSARQIGLLIAIPVFLGSLGCIPAGLLVDRFGGRRVFSLLLLLAAIPIGLVALTTNYTQLLWLGLCAGIAGSSFSIGIGFTTGWFTPDQQGTALGVYGLGSVGYSIAVLAAPVLMLATGSWRPVFVIFALLSLVWAAVFGLFARDSRPEHEAKLMRENLTGLRSAPLAWALSLFYFVTFGGLVAFTIYLPTLLQDLFKLTPADAGFRAAGFVVLATLTRPAGGLLADRVGGARTLVGVFAAVSVFALLMGVASLPVFTLGALGAATALGVGNGAIFKLVPEHFPKATGTITGVVAALGGLGGFFPAVVLGVVRDVTGGYALGFVFLAIFSLGCLLVNYLVLVRGAEGSGEAATSRA